MAITFTANFLAELKKKNTPNVIFEVALDSGTQKWGSDNGGFYDVKPIVNSVSSLQNKIDSKNFYGTRGEITFTISGRAFIQNLINTEYLMNRRVTRKEGFIANGFLYSDYAPIWTGRISNIERNGDELTITVADDQKDASKTKIPVENSAKTQFLDYRNTNPIDIMTNMLITRLGIASTQVDSTQFTAEKNQWLPTLKFDRVITEPQPVGDHLSELQQETNSFIVSDGEKITFKIFAPVMPGSGIEEYTDSIINEGTIKQKSGYKDQFYNRVIVATDYDESGSDNEINFEYWAIAADADSQGAAQWNDTTTKWIKSKWIRSRTYIQPTNITGITIYHCSRNNGTGSGTLTYNNTNKTLQWIAPSGATGEAVKITKDGKYQIYDADKTKWVRVIVTYANLPSSNQEDTIPIYAITNGGDTYAAALATRILARYRDPISIISFGLPLKNIAYGSNPIKPTDMKDITSSAFSSKGKATWSKERCMLISMRPDSEKNIIEMEAIQTKLYKRYGFIAPAGYPDYPSASAAQRQYGFIGDANNKVNGGTEDGYYIW